MLKSLLLGEKGMLLFVLSICIIYMSWLCNIFLHIIINNSGKKYMKAKSARAIDAHIFSLSGHSNLNVP